MKFLAPQHTSDAHLSNGVFPVAKDGSIEVPDDTPTADIDGLKRAGFVPVPVGQADAEQTVSTKAKPADSGAKSA